MPRDMLRKWVGLLSLWAVSCGDSPTKPADNVELNTLEYSGRFRQYGRTGLILERDLDAQELRGWRHSEIHFLLDTLRLDAGKFELVANDRLWESESTDAGIDRFKTFRGDYERRGDSLYLAVHQPQYFGRDTLAFRFSAGAIRIDFCLERVRDTVNLREEAEGGPGPCPPPDPARLADGTVLELEDVLVHFR